MLERFNHLKVPCYLMTLFVWGALSYATLFTYLSQGQLFVRQIDGTVFVSDFINHYNAGQIAKTASRESINIYDLKVQDKFAESALHSIKRDKPFYLQYPPHFFALMLPLSFLSLQQAWFLWSALSLSLMAGSLFLLTKHFPCDKQTKFFLFISTFASYPAWLSIELGQTTPLIILPVAACLVLCKSRPWLAGLANTFVSIKLQYFPYTSTAGAIAGRWPFIFSTMIFFGILNLLALSIVGANNFAVYPSALLVGETGTVTVGVSPDMMQNMRGQLNLFFGGDTQLVHILSVIFATICELVIIRTWWKAKDSNSPSAFWLASSITVLLMIIGNVHAHAQDYLLCAIPCYFMYLWSNLPGNRPKVRSLARKLVIVAPLLSWVMLIHILFQLMHVQPLFIWGAALAVCALLGFEEEIGKS